MIARRILSIVFLMLCGIVPCFSQAGPVLPASEYQARFNSFAKQDEADQMKTLGLVPEALNRMSEIVKTMPELREYFDAADRLSTFIDRVDTLQASDSAQTEKMKMLDEELEAITDRLTKNPLNPARKLAVATSRTLELGFVSDKARVRELAEKIVLEKIAEMCRTSEAYGYGCIQPRWFEPYPNIEFTRAIKRMARVRSDWFLSRIRPSKDADAVWPRLLMALTETGNRKVKPIISELLKSDKDFQVDVGLEAALLWPEKCWSSELVSLLDRTNKVKVVESMWYFDVVDRYGEPLLREIRKIWAKIDFASKDKIYRFIARMPCRTTFEMFLDPIQRQHGDEFYIPVYSLRSMIVWQLEAYGNLAKIDFQDWRFVVRGLQKAMSRKDEEERSAIHETLESFLDVGRERGFKISDN